VPGEAVSKSKLPETRCDNKQRDGYLSPLSIRQSFLLPSKLHTHPAQRCTTRHPAMRLVLFVEICCSHFMLFHHDQSTTQHIRRLNISKAKSKRTSVKEEEKYHRHSNDDEFDCRVMSDADDADVVWESLSSLTLQDYAMQSSSMRRSFPFMMLDAMPPQTRYRPTLCSTIPSLREHPMPLSSELPLSMITGPSRRSWKVPGSYCLRIWCIIRLHLQVCQPVSPHRCSSG